MYNKKIGLEKILQNVWNFPVEMILRSAKYFLRNFEDKKLLKTNCFQYIFRKFVFMEYFYGFIVLPEKLYNCFFSDLNVSSLLEREDEPAIADDRPRRQSLQ